MSEFYDEILDSTPEKFDKIWLLTTLFAKVGNKDVTLVKDLLPVS
jgi:hypothetical protein